MPTVTKKHALKPPYDRPLTPEEANERPDDFIDFSDIPELTEEFWSDARIVFPEDRQLQQVTAKFEKRVLDFFKRGGRGYQARMNAVLRAYVEAHDKDR